MAKITTDLIGKKVSCVFTGMTVIGVVTGVSEDEHARFAEVKFDNGVQWGDHVYTKTQLFERKCDNWGSAIHLEII